MGATDLLSVRCGLPWGALLAVPGQDSWQWGSVLAWSQQGPATICQGAKRQAETSPSVNHLAK